MQHLDLSKYVQMLSMHLQSGGVFPVYKANTTRQGATGEKGLLADWDPVLLWHNSWQHYSDTAKLRIRG